MYVHIGSNRMIRASQIVGVFDLDGEITTADTKRFLRRAESEGRASLAGDDLPRSFVVTANADLLPSKRFVFRLRNVRYERDIFQSLLSVLRDGL